MHIIYIYVCVCVYICVSAFDSSGRLWRRLEEFSRTRHLITRTYNKCSDRIMCVTSSPFRKLWQTHQRTDRLLVNYTSNNISWKEGIWILRMIWILWNYVFFSELFCPAYWHWEKRKRKLPHGSDQFSRIKQKKYLHNGILCI